MNELLNHYMTGDPEDFQDMLEDPLCTHDDKLDAIVQIGQNGWDECLEILVSRDDPLLTTREAAQAWVHMASNGHTDTWMQMLPAFYQGHASNPSLWIDALNVGRDDAEIDKHWEVYALCAALQGIVEQKMPSATAQMALIGMRIELMHGLDVQTANKDVADSFASRHIALAGETKNRDNVFSEMNFA